MNFATVTCRAPLVESVLIIGHGYSIPNVALEGDSVSFTCSSGLILTGPNSSICTGNGEWEPDPREVACHKRRYNNFIFDMLIIKPY